MKNTRFDLTNKTALITGGAGFLGQQHAIALLMSGANLILADIDFKKLLLVKKKLKNKFKNNKILILELDITNEILIKSKVREIKKKKITINILINNAAIDPKISKKNNITDGKKFENIQLADWNRHINVGLTGSMLCSKYFGQIISKNKNGGVILNIGSDLSVIAPNHGIYKKGVFKPVMYSVIKHGIVGLTKYISTYWNKQNIRCNMLSPGPMDNNHPILFTKKITKHIPLNRLAKKNEYIEAVQFLCSDASSYMNGQNLIIDGGRSVW